MSRFFSESVIDISEEDIKREIDNDENKDESGDWKSCRNCAKTIASIVDDTFYENIFYTDDLDDPDEILKWEEGVHQCMIEHENGDVHEFALNIEGDHLFMVATREGQEGIIKKIFPLDVWVQLYKLAKNDETMYCMCFGILKESMKYLEFPPVVTFSYRKF